MEFHSISRRDIFKLIAATSATGAIPAAAKLAPPTDPALSLTERKHTFSDPDFSNPVPLWEFPLTPAEIDTLRVLCDLIIPGDEKAPPPSKINVAEFLNEWVGAPYENNLRDKETLRGGLSWLDTHANYWHQNSFVELTEKQQTDILDAICDPAKTAPELRFGHVFFRKLRQLTLGAYYSHSSTWPSLGYVGNVPIVGPYPGVPEEVLKILGVSYDD